MLKSSGFWVGVTVFLLAILVRGVYIYDSSDNPTFDTPIVDSLTYDQMARDAVENKEITRDFFWQQFFYPFFLSVVYFFTGSSILCVKIIQILLGGVTCLLTYHLGKNIFGRASGILGACMVAVYGPLIFFEGELLAAGWAAFWAVVLITLFLKVAKDKSIKLCFTLGICGALSILTRPNFIPFLAIGCIWMIVVWVRERVGFRKLILALLTLMIGFWIVAGPVASLNYRLTHRFSLLPDTGSINLYIGNNPDFEAVSIRPGLKWKEITSLPLKHGIHKIDEARHFFNEKTFKYVRTQPISFLKGLFRKSLQFISSREMPGNIDVYLFAKWSCLLRLLVWKGNGFGFPFGLLLPLTILGTFFNWRRIPVPVLLFLIVYPATVILTHIEARYRIPVIVPMCILAGTALVKITEMLRTGHWHKALLAIMIMAGTAFLCSTAGPFYSEQAENINYEAELYFGLGDSFGKQGQTEEAIKAYSTAIEIRNDYTEAHHNLGFLLIHQGKIQSAISHYETALKSAPENAGLLRDLGQALFLTGNTGEAIDCYRKVVQLEPKKIDTYINLGNALLKVGQPSEAFKYYSEAIELEPDNAEANNNIGNFFAMQGQPDKAIVHYEISLKINPTNAKALNNLANALASLGKFRQASEKYKEALQINPNNAKVHFSLGKCFEQCEEIDKAVAEYTKALAIDPKLHWARRALDRIRQKEITK